MSAPMLRRRLAGGGLVALAVALVVAPWLAPYPDGRPVDAPFRAPASGTPLGTDHLGRDVWSQLLYDAAATIVVPLLATALLAVTATAAGMVLGLASGVLARVVRVVLDVIVVVPPLVLVLVVVSASGPGVATVVLAVVASGFGILTRVVATATRQVAGAGHVEVARGYGASASRVMIEELLPRIARIVLAETGLRLVAAVQLVAALGFLGVAAGVGGSWASAVRDGSVGLALNPWAVAGPSLALALVLILLTVLVDLLHEGDG